jgi:hypothetical protein
MTMEGLAPGERSSLMAVLVMLGLVVGCDGSSRAPVQTSAPTAVAPAAPPTPTPTPTPTPWPNPWLCPPLDHIRIYVHAQYGPKGQDLNPKSAGRVGGMAVIDTTPFFLMPSGQTAPCNADHNNCDSKPANACEDPRGQTWTSSTGTRFVTNCDPGDPGCPQTGFQIVAFWDAPGVATFTACPRPDGPPWYANGQCGTISVEVD